MQLPIMERKMGHICVLVRKKYLNNIVIAYKNSYLMYLLSSYQYLFYSLSTNFSKTFLVFPNKLHPLEANKIIVLFLKKYFFKNDNSNFKI